MALGSYLNRWLRSSYLRVAGASTCGWWWRARSQGRELVGEGDVRGELDHEFKGSWWSHQGLARSWPPRRCAQGTIMVPCFGLPPIYNPLLGRISLLKKKFDEQNFFIYCFSDFNPKRNYIRRFFIFVENSFSINVCLFFLYYCTL